MMTDPHAAEQTEYLEDEALFLAYAERDLNDFERDIIRKALKQMKQLPLEDLNLRLLKNFKKRWFEKDYCRELTKTRRSETVKTAFYGLVVREHILRKKTPLPDLHSLAQFSFYTNDTLSLVHCRRESEMHLVGFLRGIQTLLSLGLQGHNNKRLFLTVGALVEGSGQSYATGGAPSKSTRRREIIFETLTGQEPVSRGKRNPEQEREREIKREQEQGESTDSDRKEDNNAQSAGLDPGSDGASAAQGDDAGSAQSGETSSSVRTDQPTNKPLSSVNGNGEIPGAEPTKKKRGREKKSLASTMPFGQAFVAQETTTTAAAPQDALRAPAFVFSKASSGIAALLQAADVTSSMSVTSGAYTFNPSPLFRCEDESLIVSSPLFLSSHLNLLAESATLVGNSTTDNSPAAIPKKRPRDAELWRRDLPAQQKNF